MSLLPEALFEGRGADVTALWDIADTAFGGLVVILRPKEILLSDCTFACELRNAFEISQQLATSKAHF